MIHCKATYHPSAWALVMLAFTLLGTGCSAEKKQERHLERAQSYQQLGDYESAELEYRNVLRLSITNATAIRELGIIYAEQGRTAQAAALLGRAKNMNPGDLEVRGALGRLLLELGDLNSARAEAEFILDQDPQQEAGLLLLADGALRPADIESARQKLESLPASAKATAAYLVAKGVVAVRSQDIEGGEAAFKEAAALDAQLAAAQTALGALYRAQQKPALAEQHLKLGAELSPIRSPRRIIYADYLIQTEREDEGKAVLTEMIEKASQYVPAWNRLAQLALDQEDLPAAKDALNQALAVDPTNLSALMMQGRIFLAENKGTEAVRLFEQATQIYGRSPVVRYHLALAYLLENNLPKATENLESAIQLRPGYADAIVLLSDLNLREGKAQEVVDALTPLLDQQPALPRAYLLLANAYRALNQLDQAETVFGRWILQFPEDPRIPLVAGGVRLSQGNLAGARQRFDQALAIAPDYLPALEQRVNLDIRQERYADAQQLLADHLNRKGDAAEGHYLLAKVLKASGDQAGAEKEAARALELNAAFRPAQVLLASIYVETDRQGEAIAELKKAVAENAKDSATLFRLAVLQEQMQDFTAAKDSYEAVLKVNPKHAYALNNLAYLYAERLGDLERGFELAQQARQLNPSDPYTQDTLAWIVHRRGDDSWALRLLKECAEQLPNEPEVLYHLGMVHYALGEAAAARLALESALALSPDFRGNEEARRSLAILTGSTTPGEAQPLSALEAQVKEHPDDIMALLGLAAAYERAGRYEDAAKIYQVTVDKNAESIAALLGLARALSQDPAQVDEALKRARQARELKPENEEATHLLGTLAFRTRQFSWALSLLEESGRRAPADPQVLYDLAWAQYAMGQVSAAAASMQASLAKGLAGSEKDRAERFLAMNGLIADPSKLTERSSEVRAILEADQDYVPALMAAGLLGEMSQQPMNAKPVYERAIKVYPDFIPAFARLAVLLTEQAPEDPALYDYAMKVREVQRGDASMARALGVALYQRDQQERVVELMNEVLRADAQDALAHYYLGMAQAKLGREAEAKQALETALGLGLSERFVTEARKALAEFQ